MNVDAFVSQLLNGQTPLLPAMLPKDTAALLVERLKAEADRHWRIDAHVSLRCADMIMQIGQTLADAQTVALGLMARGDALKLLNRTEEAWDTLEQAGTLFLSAGDEVGWARTRIGRLGICVNLSRVDIAMREAEQAKAIFTRHHEEEKLLRLMLNAAGAYVQLGDFQHSLQLYQEALQVAEGLGNGGEARLGMIYNNLGYTQQEMGNLRQALSYYERANLIWRARGEDTGVALTDLNIATVAHAQGKYRTALNLLYRTQDTLTTHLPTESVYAQRCMIECYLSLNRYADARTLAKTIILQQSKRGETYHLAIVLLLLADAEAQLSNLSAAQHALDQAFDIFSRLDSEAWVAATRLRRSRIALQNGATAAAQHEAAAAAEFFQANHQQLDYIITILLDAQIAFSLGDMEHASNAGRAALALARGARVASLRYSAHLLLGKVAEREAKITRALRHYQAATAILEAMQHDLTITLRTGFFEDKQEAQRALIRLYLSHNLNDCAFETLERAKSQLWLSYLNNRDQLRWAHDDPHTRPLLEELNRLREEHHWFYRLTHDQTFREVQRTSIQPQQAAQEVAIRERQMRTVTERLYLQSGRDQAHQANGNTRREIEEHLDKHTLLVEYYSDETNVWAFVLDDNDLHVYALPAASESVAKLVEHLQANFSRALRAGSKAPATKALTRLSIQLLGQLYDALVKPLEEQLNHYSRLVVVPYGVLHYLPFHLLHNGKRHLTETHEIVILPAAGLIAQPTPRHKGQALVLAHTWDGRLTHTIEEAAMVCQRFNGALYCDDQATRAAFQQSPCQVLHIAAHGQYRIDQPDFSYIQLGDGQLLTDDLLQYDLDYELVVLSACETGRASVAAGDELVGLGRGFLYAGAGALVASLWRVDDALTVRWMEHFYAQLQSGDSKAAAVRHANCALLTQQPELHPVFWGAFQLIGNPDPLTTTISQPGE